MTSFQETFRPWTDNKPLDALKRLLEAALFRNPEPQPVSPLRMIIDPPMPYWVTVFSQSCRIISLLILLPIILIGVLDFAGYAVFRTLGLHRRRVRIQRQTKQGVKVPLGRSSSRRKRHVYQNDRNRPTDRSNIPSIVEAPLLSPGTYDAETLLRQRARSLSIASVEEHAEWLASGGQQARLSTLNRDDGADLSLASLDSDVASPGEADASRDYFGRAPRVGVDGALGMADTDAESGTESGIDSPVQSRSSSRTSRRRILSGGFNFTPVSHYPPSSPAIATHAQEHASAAADVHSETLPPHHADTGSVVSLSSDSPTSSTNGDRLQPGGIGKHANRSDGETSGSNMSSSWIGVEADPVTVDPVHAAAAAELEPGTHR